MKKDRVRCERDRVRKKWGESDSKVPKEEWLRGVYSNVHNIYIYVNKYIYIYQRERV